jgi:predicted glutamine amidotransferase
MIVGAGSFSVDYLVLGLRNMAAVGNHVAGWGGVRVNGGGVEVVRSVKPCLEDSALEEFRKVRSPLVVLHARKASESSEEYTHPFDINGYQFFHNTWFNEGEYDPARLAEHVGKFLKPGEEEASLAKAYAGLRHVALANSVLVGPDKAIVVVRYDRNSKKASPMAFSRDKLSVVVSSETLPGRKWSYLHDRAMFTVRPDGTCSYVTDFRELT